MANGNQLPQPGGGQRDQTKFIVFENFEKMNTQSIRQSLSEKELAWLENLQPIAGNNLTTVPAPAVAALATIGETISTMFYADLMGVDYFAVFTFDGSGYLINIATGGINHFAPDGTFSPYPDVTTWQASRLLIADPIAGYTSADGISFAQQGGVSPNITVTNGGAGYGSVPTVTISGGSGTGATAHAVVTNGVVTAIVLDNPGHGYQPTDVLVVTISGSAGSGATGHVTMTGSPVGSLQIIDQGSFNSPLPGNQTLSFSGGGGTGAAGYCLVAQDPHVSSLRYVSAILLTSPGSGYTSTPSATLATSGGVPPAFQVTLGTENVATIVLDSGGSGYLGPPAVLITPSDGIGSGAEAVTTLAGTSVNTLTLDPSGVVTLQTAFQGVSSTPGTYALSFTGGGGTLAAGTATIGNYTNNGGGTSVGVIALNITNSGTGYTTAPAVAVVGATFSVNPTLFAVIQSQGAGYDATPNVLIGAGVGAAAEAHVWPFINSSIGAYAFTTVAIFQGRVWLGGGQLLTWSGTGASYGNVAYDDFLAADASGSLIISDADLIHAITALRSLNNYLWIMGDQSVKQIGNISLNSAGNVTLFTILTLSSDQGTIYKKSCISYNRVFMFANSNGIYGVFGSSVQKLSSDMDGIWKQVDFTLQPQGALADINAIHNAVFLVSYVDSSMPPISSAQPDNTWTVVAFVTLSNTNHTATLVPSNTGEALSANSYPGGNIYAEFAVTIDFTEAASSIEVADLLAGTGVSISAAGGAISTSAGPVGSIGNFNGKILRLALDATNALAWFSINGAPWNGSGTADPTTGVGGINFPTSSGPSGPNLNHDPLFFSVSIAGQNIGDAPAATINTAGPLVYSNPFVPVTGRSIMLAFDGKKWFVLNQGEMLTAIATSASFSTGQNSLYGSGGVYVIELLASPTIAVDFKIETAMTHHGNAVQAKKIIRAGFSSDSASALNGVTMIMDTEEGNGTTNEMMLGGAFQLTGGANDGNNDPIAGTGIYLGMTIEGTLADFTMTNMIIEYQETQLWKAVPPKLAPPYVPGAVSWTAVFTIGSGFEANPVIVAYTVNGDPSPPPASGINNILNFPPSSNLVLQAGWFNSNIGFAVFNPAEISYSFDTDEVSATFISFGPGPFRNSGQTSPDPTQTYGVSNYIFQATDVNGDTIVEIAGNLPVDITLGAWHSYAFSVNTATQQIQFMFDNQLIDLTGSLPGFGPSGYATGPITVWSSTNAIDWGSTPGGDFWVLSNRVGYSGAQTSVSDTLLAIPTSFFDLSVSANARKLFTVANTPVYWGADGSLPTGTVPPIYLTGNAQTYANINLYLPNFMGWQFDYQNLGIAAFINVTPP